MAQKNVGQDLNFPVDVKANQIKKTIRRKKFVLEVFVIASVILTVIAIFTVKLQINPPLPGGFK